jgi:short-subunit dehydrogenase
VADFSKLSTLEEYRTLIETSLGGVDIGMVCLNAGITVIGNLNDLSDQEFESVIRVNGLHVMYSSKVFLELLNKREQRSALVITSSMASNFSFPGMAVYGATKALVRNFG